MIATHAEAVMGALIAFGNLPLATGFDLAVAPTDLTEWSTTGDPDAWPRPRWALLRLNDSAHLAQLAD